MKRDMRNCKEKRVEKLRDEFVIQQVFSSVYDSSNCANWINICVYTVRLSLGYHFKQVAYMK